MQNNKTSRIEQAIERIDKNIIINKLFFYDKNTQFIDRTNEFVSLVLSAKDINVRKFEIELKSIVGKKCFIDEKERKIKFSEKEELNLKHLFDLISKALFYKDENKANKHFDELLIANNLIESIDDDVLGEISFDKIVINDCPKLKRIHCKAFGKIDKIKEFYAFNGLPNLISKPDSDYDLMKLINSLVNCEVIRMKPFQSNLQPIKLKKLKELSLNGRYSSIKIESIEDYAFDECDEIESIDLSLNRIYFIGENVFHFKNQSDKQLKILLEGNKLRESSFAMDSLKNIKRPTELNLGYNRIRYLRKKIFKPFFDADERNQVKVYNKYLEWTGEKNLWYKDDDRYKCEDFHRHRILKRRSENVQDADINIPNKYIRTSLDLAAEKGKLNVIDIKFYK